MLADSHAHLDTFSPEALPQVLQRSQEAGVSLILSVGMNLDSSRAAVRLAGQNEMVYPAIGIHPWEAQEIDLELSGRLRALARRPKVVAVSEIGLDFARRSDNKEVQMLCFRHQVRLAREEELPVLVHSREAHHEVLTILREEGGYQVSGAVHGFTGTAAEVLDWLGLGFSVSIGRALLRAEMAHLAEVVPLIPLERLLLETDAYAGPAATATSEPATVRQVAERVANLRGLTLEQVAEATTNNLKALLGI